MRFRKRELQHKELKKKQERIGIKTLVNGDKVPAEEKMFVLGENEVSGGRPSSFSGEQLQAIQLAFKDFIELSAVPTKQEVLRTTDSEQELKGLDFLRIKN